MAPTLVTHGGRTLLTVGSPGGSMIITTVLQLLSTGLDGGMTLPQAIADPRASRQRRDDRGGAGVPRLPVAAALRGTRPSLRDGGRDRRRDRDRVPAGRRGGSGRRAVPPRRRQRDGGDADALTERTPESDLEDVDRQAPVFGVAPARQGRASRTYAFTRSSLPFILRPVRASTSVRAARPGSARR